VTHDERPGNLTHSVRGLLGCAYGTRDYWSVSVWRLLDRIERDWGRRTRRRGHGRERTDLWLGRLIDTLAGLAGLASETLPRESAFRFFDLGRRIERGLTLCTQISHMLESRLEDEAERESLSLLLQSADSLITFRRRFRAEPFRAGVLSLLLWDHASPRALIYQLRTARLHLAEMLRDTRGSSAERLLFSAEERLLVAEARAAQGGDDAGLGDSLEEVSDYLRGVSEAIGHIWFTHVQEAHPLRPMPRPPEP
jgi:uncharacterized alpha-E superfamily protein